MRERLVESGFQLIPFSRSTVDVYRVQRLEEIARLRIELPLAASKSNRFSLDRLRRSFLSLRLTKCLQPFLLLERAFVGVGGCVPSN